MANIQDNETVIGEIKFVPFHHVGFVNQAAIEAHYIGTVEEAYNPRMRDFYRLTDEGIDTIEVSGTTYEDCENALRAEVSARGWANCFKLRRDFTQPPGGWRDLA